MFRHLIVPVDGSPNSWRSFPVALALAKRCGGNIQVVKVARDPVNGRDAKKRLDEELEQRGPFDVAVTTDVRLTNGSVADELSQLVLLHPGAVIVMSSHGKGRSAAIVSSVTEDVLYRSYGPVVLVGPHVEPDDFSGPIIVSVDGSEESEISLRLAAAWAVELRSTPWIVIATMPNSVILGGASAAFGTAYPARLAKKLAASSGHPVEFEELHHRHPERAVPEYASRHGASMIVASSHGRSGLSRLAMGSTTAGFVRHAKCPVAVVRLPHPVHVDQPERIWAY